MTGFVLPQGPSHSTLHLCRCGSKEGGASAGTPGESGVRFDPISIASPTCWPTSSSCSPSTSKQAWDVTEVPYVSINY